MSVPRLKGRRPVRNPSENRSGRTCRAYSPTILLLWLNLPGVVKLVLVLAITMAVMLLAYDRLVRPTFLGAMLNGRKLPRWAWQPGSERPTDSDEPGLSRADPEIVGPECGCRRQDPTRIQT